MKTPTARWLATAAGITVLTGCSSHINGLAQPAVSISPSTTAGSPNPFENLNQCAVLDRLAAGQGFPRATPGIADPDHVCGATKPSTAEVQGLDVAITFHPGRSYLENNTKPDAARRGDVNGRPSIKEPAPLGSRGQCAIAMSVSPHSRAIVDVAMGSDTTAACAKAEEYAVQLEPMLPKP